MRTGTIHFCVPVFVIIISPFSLFEGYQHVRLPIITSIPTDKPSQYHAMSPHPWDAPVNGYMEANA